MISRSKIVKYCFGLLVLFLIGGGLAYGLNYKNSFTLLTIKTSLSNKISVFNTSSSDKVTGYEYDARSKPVFTTTGGGTVKLKKATYVVVVNDPNGDYKNDKTDIFPRTKDYTITVNPGFSQNKLALLLATEQPAIDQAISSQVHNSTINHKIESETLFEHGQWAGALLVPSNKDDVYRVILNKLNGQWKVVTNPPQINIAGPLFPDIPSNVVAAVDNQL